MYSLEAGGIMKGERSENVLNKALIDSYLAHLSNAFIYLMFFSKIYKLQDHITEDFETIFNEMIL